jgi:hypothetical protein
MDRGGDIDRGTLKGVALKGVALPSGRDRVNRLDGRGLRRPGQPPADRLART